MFEKTKRFFASWFYVAPMTVAEESVCKHAILINHQGLAVPLLTEDVRVWRRGKRFGYSFTPNRFVTAPIP